MSDTAAPLIPAALAVFLSMTVSCPRPLKYSDTVFASDIASLLSGRATIANFIFITPFSFWVCFFVFVLSGVFSLSQVFDGFVVNFAVGGYEALSAAYVVGEVHGLPVLVGYPAARFRAEEDSCRGIGHAQGVSEVYEAVEPAAADIAEFECGCAVESPAADFRADFEDGLGVELLAVDADCALLEEVCRGDVYPLSVTVCAFSEFGVEGFAVCEVADIRLFCDSGFGVCDRECVERVAGDGIVRSVDGVEVDGSGASPHVDVPYLFADEIFARTVAPEAFYDYLLGDFVDGFGGGTVRAHFDDVSAFFRPY